MNAKELVGYSRLWKFEGSETLDDAKDMVKKSNYSNFPLDI